MKKIFYFTNIAPHYRIAVWKGFLNHKSYDFHIFYGNTSNRLGVKEIDIEELEKSTKGGRITKIRNIRIKDYLVWQTGVIKNCLVNKPDTTMFLGTMHILSSWIAIIICRIKGIKVIIWGHGLYGKENILVKALTLLFYKLANKIAVYNHRSKRLLVESGIDEGKISVVYNSLDYDRFYKCRKENTDLGKEKFMQFFPNPDLPLLIFIGRLTPVKKLDILIRAFAILNSDNFACNLLIIGGGPEKAGLENLSKKWIEKGNLKFLGASYDEDINGKYLTMADLCVSPGNVGLTAIHALSYGTPVCTHDNLTNQMPEHEAITNGVTGFYFRENDANDLAVGISKWFKMNHDREQVRLQCFNVIDKQYNPYHQLKIFEQIL